MYCILNQLKVCLYCLNVNALIHMLVSVRVQYTITEYKGHKSWVQPTALLTWNKVLNFQWKISVAQKNLFTYSLGPNSKNKPNSELNLSLQGFWIFVSQQFINWRCLQNWPMNLLVRRENLIANLGGILVMTLLDKSQPFSSVCRIRW